MKEEYLDPLVSWDVADKARDIGFKDYCVESFVRTDEVKEHQSVIDSTYTGLIPDMWEWECYRPSLGQLRTWIGKTYDVEVNITPYSYFVNKVKHKYWSFEVLTGDTMTLTLGKTGYTSFDLALDDALHGAIKWIIKIQKNV